MINKLNIAKKTKDDEFYTLPEDVSSEMSHYDFTGKRVFCPWFIRLIVRRKRNSNEPAD